MKRFMAMKPIPYKVRCTGPNGAVADVTNPLWPPKNKWECNSEDYGDWVFEELKPFFEKMYRDCCVMWEALEGMIDDCDCEGDETTGPIGNCKDCTISKALSQVSHYPKP